MFKIGLGLSIADAIAMKCASGKDLRVVYRQREVRTAVKNP
jgi:hypothetical protein